MSNGTSNDTWVPQAPLVPANSWSSTCGCAPSPPTSIADDIVITGVPPTIVSSDPNQNTQWRITLGDGTAANSFTVDRFNNGVLVDSPISISQTTGATTFVDEVIVPTPVNGGDAATKTYVDGAIAGLPSNALPLMDGSPAAGLATFYARGDHIHPTDTSRAPLASPAFTGTPTAPTVTPATDSSTKLATTAFVQNAVGSLGVSSWNTRTGAVTMTLADVTGVGGAPLASPGLTGAPTAPTPTTADNSTAISTTAFVKAQGYLTGNQSVTLSGDVAGSGATAITTTLATVNSNVGTFQGLTVNAKGLVTAASNQNYAPIASPTFTGTVTIPSGASIAGYALLASPALTGTPTAPTPAAGTNSTQLATTAYVDQHGWGRNRIINGAMRVDQWNAGAQITPVTAQLACDRWKAGLTQASKFTTQQIDISTGNLPAGFPAMAAFKIVSSSAFTSASTDYFRVFQTFEGFNVNDLLWGTSAAAPVVLQFEAQASIAGTYSGVIANAAGTRAYPFTFVLSANTPALVTVPIPGDTAGTWTVAGNTLWGHVDFDLGCGSTYRGPAGAWASANYLGVTGAASLVATSGATLWISNVKLEKGLVATPFEEEDVATTLAKCQRYYERSYDPGTATGAVTAIGSDQFSINGMPSAAYGAYIQVRFKATKRADATVTAYSPGTGASGQLRNTIGTPADVAATVTNASASGCVINSATLAASTAIGVQVHWTANAEL